MCGRYYIEDEESIVEIREIIDEINRRHHDTESTPVKTGEVFPTNVAPVLMGANNALQPAAMRWGFPKWQGSGVVINARSETAAEKNMFRRSLLERRIVVPTTGFYEWRRKGEQKSKDKFLFRKDGQKMLYLAGIYNLFAQEDGTKEERFVILTTAANESMEPYHDRMPVILDKEEREEWIFDDQDYAQLIGREPPALIAQEMKASEQLDLFSLNNL